MRYEVHPVNPQPRIVKLAAETLEKDGIVLYPTESGYAVGCNAESPKAIHKLYLLKKPMKKLVMALILPDIRRASEYAHVSNFAISIMNEIKIFLLKLRVENLHFLTLRVELTK